MELRESIRVSVQELPGKLAYTVKRLLEYHPWRLYSSATKKIDGVYWDMEKLPQARHSGTAIKVKVVKKWAKS